MKQHFSLHFTLFFIVLSFQTSFGQTAKEIATTMFAKTKEINSMTYSMKKMERINGKFILQQSTIKLNQNPFMVYLKQDSPNQGLEVLYVTGKNSNNALINPNGFPWFSINLNPYGSSMRENQHHTLFNSGYDHVVSILEHLFDKHQLEIESMIKKEGSIIWDDHACWVISLSNPSFKYYNYTTSKGETLLTIATKFKLSEHMILEKNPSVKSYSYPIPSGTIIQIPNDYSSKMILYIDKQRAIPLLMKIYDNEGLYEQYEYSNVLINPTIDSKEFSKDYKSYHF